MRLTSVRMFSLDQLNNRQPRSSAGCCSAKAVAPCFCSSVVKEQARTPFFFSAFN